MYRVCVCLELSSARLAGILSVGDSGAGNLVSDNTLHSIANNVHCPCPMNGLNCVVVRPLRYSIENGARLCVTIILLAVKVVHRRIRCAAADEPVSLRTTCYALHSRHARRGHYVCHTRQIQLEIIASYRRSPKRDILNPTRDCLICGYVSHIYTLRRIYRRYNLTSKSQSKKKNR